MWPMLIAQSCIRPVLGKKAAAAPPYAVSKPWQVVLAR